MSELMFFASPSKLGTWKQCPRRYRFRYIEKLPTIPRPWFAFGASVHAALKEIFNIRPENRSVELLEKFLETNWVRKGYASAEEEAEYRERAVGALRRYAAEEPDFATAPRPKVLEFTVEAKIGDVVLMGKVDRIDDTPDGLVVIDYKTGRSRPPEEARGDTAFTMYAMLVAHRFKRAPKALEWRYVETGDRVVTQREPEAFERVRAEVLAEVARIREEVEFPPSPGPGCVFCDYLDRCPEGRAAVPPAPRAPEPAAEEQPGED